jgi:hypothetical protein
VKLLVCKAPQKWAEQIVEVPPDAPPEWVERIHEQIFEKVLPLKKNMSIEFLDAAIFGYSYAAISRELAWHGRATPGTEEREVYEEHRTHYEPTLGACRRRVAEVVADWKLSEAADYLKGFAYGIECQHREEGWTPSATTETLQIYKALLRHQDHVESLIQQKATAEEIGQYIAKHAAMSSGMTYAQYFETCKKVAQDRVVARVEDEEDKEKNQFLKFIKKICERIGLPLPSPGRPPTNRQITTPEN